MRENLSPKSLTPQVIAMLRARPVRQPKEEQHKYQPPSPATRSLREPTEWKGLREDIDDLRRFSRLSRRLRMRSAGASHQHIGQLQKLERHAVQRRSMPEIQRADLVYLRAPEPKMSRGQACRSEEQLSSDWKPRTEFERTYFGDIHDNPRPSSSLNYHECNDQHVAKKEDKLPEQTSETRKKFDQNSNLVAVESRVKLAEDDFYDPAEIPRRIDDYVVPHSPEFRTSRERLHEIFEHNRYLRRKFFADLPAGSAEKSTDNQNRGSCKKASVKRNEEYPKSSGLGFGSTETLTSQSNHSAGSSTDGRKSRAGNTPDSDIDRAKPETLTRPSKLEPLPLTYFGSERYGGTWRSCTTSRCSVGSWNESRPHRDQGIGKSMPDLSALSTAPSSRLAASSSSAELAGAGNESDAKYFASYVHVVDSSDGESRSASPPTATRRRGPLPPALDLSKLDRENRQDPELSVLRNYRQEPAASFEVEALIARSRERVLRSSHSLLELSSSIGNGPSSGRRETRLERMIRRRGQSAFNKSCTDLASLSQDTTGLLSPRLVGAASRERLAEEEEEEEKRRASTSPEHALAGTTLPSLYGPMPYSQYLPDGVNAS